MNNKKELIAKISEHKNYIRKNDERSPTARHFQLAGGSVVTGNGVVGLLKRVVVREGKPSKGSPLDI